VRGLAGLSLTYPKHPSADEQPWMRATIEHCGIPWHPIDVDSALPFTRLPEEFLAEPSPALLHSELLRTEAKLLAEHGATLLLTGDGGDAILATNPGNSPTHLADGLFSARPARAFGAMNAWRQRSGERRSWSYWTLRTLVRPAMQHVLGWQIRPQPRIATPPWMDGGYVARMRLATRGRARLAPRCELPSQQAIADTLWSVALSVGRGQPQHRGFAIRYPLLHRPLAEFLFGAPWEEKLHPRCDRYLQRRAMKGILPELVRRRAHKAIGSYGYVEGLRRSAGWFEYLCDDPLLTTLGVATAEQWRTAVTQASLGQTHGDRFFLTAAAIEAWLKTLQAWRRDRRAGV
jgi:asparagine synthase (glutamine-hydrolysing)